MCDKCLVWDEKERKEVESRILKLKDDSLLELFEQIGITWEISDEEVVGDIREGKYDSNCLDVLMSEPSSKENLLEHLSILERQNKEEVLH